MKKCTKCKKEKTKVNFSKRSKSKDGLNLWCKKCCIEAGKEWTKNNPNRVKRLKKSYYDCYPDRVHNKELKHKFGITKEEYDKMLAEQNNKCKICDKEEMTKGRSGKVRKMAVDHCHKTDKVRGLLCAKCNQALGLLNDDINSLKEL